MKKKIVKFDIYSIVGMSINKSHWRERERERERVAIIYKVEKSMHGYEILYRLRV